ncbi:MAG: TIGR03560 family F420-dependent LLM class oxidoreductase [Candidatus Binatia bacterium]
MAVERITFKTKPERCTWQQLLDFWLEGERVAIYDGSFLFDHFYPLYGDAGGPCFEGWTALSYLAGRTQRLRLGLMVTGVPYRNPAVLANMASTFDHFSGGRLDLGLGAGWHDGEATAYGMPLLPIGQRLDQFEEACAVLTALFERDETTFDGTYYRLAAARAEPKPLQRPHPPFVIGGGGEKRMLKIIARYADDWNYVGGPVDDFRRKVEILHRHCATVGRDPQQITLSSHIMAGDSPAQTAEQAATFAAAGAEHLCLYFVDNTRPDLLGPTAEAVAAAVGYRLDGSGKECR